MSISPLHLENITRTSKLFFVFHIYNHPYLLYIVFSVWLYIGILQYNIHKIFSFRSCRMNYFYYQLSYRWMIYWFDNQNEIQLWKVLFWNDRKCEKLLRTKIRNNKKQICKKMKEKLLILLNLKEQVKNKELESKKNWLLTKKTLFRFPNHFKYFFASTKIVFISIAFSIRPFLSHFWKYNNQANESASSCMNKLFFDQTNSTFCTLINVSK